MAPALSSIIRGGRNSSFSYEATWCHSYMCADKKKEVLFPLYYIIRVVYSVNIFT